MRILQPQRGARAEYLRLVKKNAEQNLKAFLAHQEVQETAQARSLTDLADALELPEPPHRIECYDVSNIQGTNPVASMVVFVEGRAKKSEYRKFKIQYDRGPNDFAMMQETLRRRLRYLRRETDRVDTPMERELAKKERFNKKPDLLLIDGGKGQLGAVVEVLEELDMTGLPVAGLAKEHEWLYLPNQPDPIVLAAELSGPASGAANPRRSAPFCGHLPSPAACQVDDPLRAGRARRRRPGKEKTAADRLRLPGRDSPRRHRRNRGRQRDDARVGRKDKAGTGRRVSLLNWLLRFLVNAIVLYLIARYVPGFNHTVTIWTAVIAAIVFGLVNAIIGPILRLISLPLTWITHGLFSIVINYVLFATHGLDCAEFPHHR